jgi:hypothetical protein
MIERHVRCKSVCDDCETLNHAMRKFFELHATNKSMLAAQALHYIQVAVLNREQSLRSGTRFTAENTAKKADSVMDILHPWMLTLRDLVPDDSAIYRALDYSAECWAALSMTVRTHLTTIGP